MAVTIHSKPQLYTPSDNPIVWTFSSNATANANFSYLVELRVNDALTGTHQIYPESGAYAHFDASDIIKTMCNTMGVNPSLLLQQAYDYTAFYITVKEYYGTTPTVHSTASTTPSIAFKARLDNKDFENWDYTEWNGLKFLTDVPDNLSIPLSSNYLPSILCIYKATLYVKLYDASGTLLDTITDDIETPVIQLNLNSDILDSSFINDTEYIEYYIQDFATGLIKSEIKRFYIDRKCQNGYPLYWLNKYGSFDTFNFSFNAIFSSEISSKTYEKQFGEWVGNVYTLDASNSGVLSYFKSANDSIQLVSNYIDQATQNWLVRSCYLSPVVYILDTTYDRVVIENTAYTENQDRFIEEYTEIVTLKLPNTRKSIVV